MRAEQAIEMSSAMPHLLRLRSGAIAHVQFVAADDEPRLQQYFASLSQRSRYNRFTGARGGLTHQEFEEMSHIGERDRFALVVRQLIDGANVIVAEARYGLDYVADTLEFGLSVQDAHRGQGIGLALLFNLECRARMLGISRMFGDTLRTNDEMQGLGRRAGFSFVATPGDGREVRLVKTVDSCRDPLEFYPDVQRNAARQLMTA
jgi:GNAT superfamily N-acetyltransferase